MIPSYEELVVFYASLCLYFGNIPMYLVRVLQRKNNRRPYMHKWDYMY